MSVANLNEFPLHELSTNMSTIRFSLLIIGLIKFFIVQILLHRKRISLFFTAESHAAAADDDSNTNIKVAEIKSDDESVCEGEQLETVMARLGISGQGKLPAKMGGDEIFEMFEKKEPSLGEVREAFDVFDQNGDGFIDEMELQRVLCGLGFKEGVEIENCRRMIGAVDEAGEGRIGFDQFVKFMENNFA
ncbi:probable calcium-binding protein CML46 [Salvia hispanica]|uniref:probable calcium-binding protein CML46 n=1 Tax=Salvia hispanica TaxID=49212 RepID=UPI002009B32C|nr:probable calcium-binding protein CML46 [Salvia hispanica]